MLQLHINHHFHHPRGKMVIRDMSRGNILDIYQVILPTKNINDQQQQQNR